MFLGYPRFSIEFVFPPGTPSLYVEQQEITGYNGEKITINCRYHNSGEMKWCRLGSSCVTRVGLIDGTRVTISNVFTVTMRGLRTESSGWYMCVKGDLQMPVHLSVTERPTTSKYYNYKSFKYMFIDIFQVQPFVNDLI